MNIGGICHRILLELVSSLFFLLDFYHDHDGILGQIWKLVVSSVCWSIWLARNEVVFKQGRMDRNTLHILIFLRINKWWTAVNLIPFGGDPLWLLNPQGIINICHHELHLNYWNSRRSVFDFVCAVDGSWECSVNNFTAAGIGGNIVNKLGQIVYSFLWTYNDP